MVSLDVYVAMHSDDLLCGLITIHSYFITAALKGKYFEFWFKTFVSLQHQKGLQSASYHHFSAYVVWRRLLKQYSLILSPCCAVISTSAIFSWIFGTQLMLLSENSGQSTFWSIYNTLPRPHNAFSVPGLIFSCLFFLSKWDYWAWDRQSILRSEKSIMNAPECGLTSTV